MTEQEAPSAMAEAEIAHDTREQWATKIADHLAKITDDPMKGWSVAYSIVDDFIDHLAATAAKEPAPPPAAVRSAEDDVRKLAEAIVEGDAGHRTIEGRTFALPHEINKLARYILATPQAPAPTHRCISCKREWTSTDMERDFLNPNGMCPVCKTACVKMDKPPVAQDPAPGDARTTAEQWLSEWVPKIIEEAKLYGRYPIGIVRSLRDLEQRLSPAAMDAEVEEIRQRYAKPQFNAGEHNEIMERMSSFPLNLGVRISKAFDQYEVDIAKLLQFLETAERRVKEAEAPYAPHADEADLRRMCASLQVDNTHLRKTLASALEGKRTPGSKEVCQLCDLPVNLGLISCNDVRVKKRGDPCPLRSSAPAGGGK